MAERTSEDDSGDDSTMDLYPAINQPSLLGIPSEIRVHIYKILFEHLEPIRLAVTIDGHLMHENDLELQLPLSLLKTCRKIFLEASPVMYECNKYRMSWDSLTRVGRLQHGISDFLRMIDIDCTFGQVWGYAKSINSLVQKASGLREINLNFQGTSRLGAAALELSHAVIPCSSAFEGPDLELAVSLFQFDDKIRAAEDTWPTVRKLHSALFKKEAKLSDILDLNEPQTMTFITKSNTSNLGVIRVKGKIHPFLLEKLEEHKCLIGDCAWKKVSEEFALDVTDDPYMSTKRIRFKWEKIDQPKKPIPPNMLQWYPGVDKAILKEITGGTEEEANDEAENQGEDDDD
ncbi:uncharacterized protein Z518_07768 [Rhinocladiella mackenziei CBS 650.93]|uniref:Uncharacterized protein n=1 Tax=Rhinocladiella mackenziei CBS 650.93 TaxID=1442369 RepID=A0A0D2IEF9_9EURO|nr:uncharacterized protein Z518_07768 [Rhinocladiella mackenziei CBS 650.93]KIX04214.1 hypothetical protein Z518_07768 [Rhinocladiella mackenziei CBS 650.93]